MHYPRVLTLLSREVTLQSVVGFILSITMHTSLVGHCTYQWWFKAITTLLFVVVFLMSSVCAFGQVTHHIQYQVLTLLHLLTPQPPPPPRLVEGSGVTVIWTPAYNMPSPTSFQFSPQSRPNLIKSLCVV